jgi:hypothetical protein
MYFPLSPIVSKDMVISVTGKVLYNDHKRKIDLKRPIRDLFDSTSIKIFYMMELCLSEEKAIERIKELSRKNVMPVILYFMEETSQDGEMS